MQALPMSAATPKSAAASRRPLSALDGKPGRLAILASRVSVAAVFLFAAFPKLQDPATFARDIDNYHVLPDAMVGPMAIAMPIAEVLVALALLLGVHARGAALVTAGMLVTFIAAMAQALARGIDLDCGCFGSAAPTQVSGLSIGRNVLLLALTLLVILGPDVDWRRPFGGPPTDESPEAAPPQAA